MQAQEHMCVSFLVAFGHCRLRLALQNGNNVRESGTLVLAFHLPAGVRWPTWVRQKANRRTTKDEHIYVYRQRQFASMTVQRKLGS